MKNIKLSIWLPLSLLAAFLWFNGMIQERYLHATNESLLLSDYKAADATVTVRFNNESSHHVKGMQQQEELRPFRDQLENITQAYIANGQYPAYSKPLQQTDWNLMNPRAFIPQAMAISESNNVLLSVATPHYIHNRKLELPIKVVVETEDGEPLPSKIQSVLVRVSQNEFETNAVQLSIAEQSESSMVLAGNMPVGYLSGLFEGPSTIHAEVEFYNGWQSQSAAQIQLFDPKAILSEIGEAFVKGSNLVIPLSFNVYESGYYRVRANLFDRTGKEPISHLNVALHLEEGQEQGMLRVHAATLRAKGWEGPYLLTGFDIIKQPSKPGEKTAFGSSLISRSIIKGYDLAAYDDKPHESEQVASSVEFLERLSTIR